MFAACKPLGVSLINVTLLSGPSTSATGVYCYVASVSQFGSEVAAGVALVEK